METQTNLLGRQDVGGIWLAFWLIGNLGHHMYVGLSEHIWTFSTTECTDYT